MSWSVNAHISLNDGSFRDALLLIHIYEAWVSGL